LVSLRHTSIDQQVGDAVECIADAKEDNFPDFTLIDGVWPVKYLVSKSNNNPRIARRHAGGSLLDVVVPQVACQLLGGCRSVLIFILVSAGRLNLVKVEFGVSEGSAG
jgi:hypothetical protein